MKTIIRGFAARDLRGAFNEAYAVSRGTRCKQYLYSCSLNPSAPANVKIEDFEAAITRIETELGLTGQPLRLSSTKRAGGGTRIASGRASARTI